MRSKRIAKEKMFSFFSSKQHKTDRKTGSSLSKDSYNILIQNHAYSQDQLYMLFFLQGFVLTIGISLQQPVEFSSAHKSLKKNKPQNLKSTYTCINLGNTIFT